MTCVRCPHCTCDCGTCEPAPSPAILGVASLNLQAKAARKHPERLYADLVTLLGTYHIIGVQEAGPPASKAVLQRLVDNGHAEVWHYPGHGAAGTAIIVRADVPDDWEGDGYQLTPNGLRVGPGAGPSKLIPKWLNTVTFVFAGRQVTVGNVHGIASAYLPNRKAKAAALFAKVAAVVKGLRGAVILTGDLNRPAGHKMLERTLYRALTSTQVLLGTVRTHARIASGIDDVLHRDPPNAKRPVLTVLERRTHKTVSDHLAYGVLYGVTPGPH